MTDHRVLWRRWIGPATVPSAAALSLVAAAGWFGRGFLHDLWRNRPAVLPATIVGAIGWVAATWTLQRARRAAAIRRYLRQVESWSEIGSLGAEPGWLRWLGRLPDPLEWVFGPILATVWGKKLTDRWQRSGFGRKGSRLLLALLGIGALGGWLGFRFGGGILAGALALVLPLPLFHLVRRQAEAEDRRFGEQVPGALDSLAAGLAAGLSFQMAVQFAAEEMPEPIRGSLARLAQRMELGVSVEESLRRFLGESPTEGLRLAVEGIILQRRLGGDLVKLLADAAGLVRERVELEREVQAVTAQGRLSGWVVALLVPASATLLLATNPAYVDILFDSTIGQILLVVALALQLIGWAVISRLIRVEY